MDETVFQAHPAATIVRLVILLVGFTLFMACVKFAWLAMRNGEGYRAWGIGAFALFIITPGIAGLYNFGRPLVLLPTITYGLGLVCGLMALRSSYTVSVDWARIRSRDAERKHRTP